MYIETCSSRIRVKHVKLQWFIFRMVKIDDGKRFHGAEMRGRIYFCDLRSLLNWCNVGGLISAQGEINCPKSFHAVNLLGGRNFFKLRKGLINEKIGWLR